MRCFVRKFCSLFVLRTERYHQGGKRILCDTVSLRQHLNDRKKRELQLRSLHFAYDAFLLPAFDHSSWTLEEEAANSKEVVAASDYGPVKVDDDPDDDEEGEAEEKQEFQQEKDDQTEEGSMRRVNSEEDAVAYLFFVLFLLHGEQCRVTSLTTYLRTTQHPKIRKVCGNVKMKDFLAKHSDVFWLRPLPYPCAKGGEHILCDTMGLVELDEERKSALRARSFPFASEMQL
ncbi:unnamed protein product [Polarella glacialis]|uniref:Uncharacterized protein n=1 Tax=Polarella glacialis TaxID=89957 RepID=A0A813IXE4_POLGL|nr:unnamed protein product [Polarella glacialis]